MKILVLNGSPKAKSDTMRITDAFLSGVKTVCDAEIDIIHVIEKDIKPCFGCFSCWQTDNSVCVQDDDMSGIISEMQKADITIWSFPLYCYGMPSHLKAVCDRQIPMIKLNMKKENERIVHEAKEDTRFSRAVMICGCGFPSFKGNFEPAVMQFSNMFGEDSLKICISEAPMLNIPDAKPLSEPLLEKIKAAGAQYITSGFSLSRETLDEIEAPMIPTEEYLAIINSIH